MSLYAYKAMNSAGRIKRGRLDAVNLADLEMRLKHLGLDLVNCAPTQAERRTSAAVSRRHLIHFCFHLDQLLRAGVPIVEGLADLRDSLENHRMREVLTVMVESIEGGRSLSQAMAEHPQVFGDIFVGLIKAGESSGQLPQVLRSLHDTLRWQDELAAHTRKLLLYPAFLACFVAGAFFFVMLHLVPKLAGFMGNLGQQIPLQTRLLIATSDFVVAHWPWLLAMPILVLLSLRLALRNSLRLRRRLDGLQLRLPLIGPLLHKIVLARFASTFALLYRSGIPILTALRDTEAVVGNCAIEDGLRQAREAIADGQSVAAAFQQAQLFPPLVLRMLRVGESTGALDTALDNVGYFYSRDVKEGIERIQVLIEPVMTAIVGLFLAWVMLAVLGPVYDTVARIKL